MKIAVLTAAVVILAVSAQGKSDSGREVTVYLDNSIAVPGIDRLRAQLVASNMFAGIGVALHWKSTNASRPEPGAIVIELATDIPAALLTEAYAYALPLEGVHIRIFWNRISAEPSPGELLAHVMAHEITHILQGIDRHSTEGIMKAHWTDKDRSAMKFRPLHFAPEDVIMIYSGLAARAPL